MPSKWEIERAVWMSSMASQSKTLMGALLFKANSKTGRIPARFQPSLTELQSLTSLSRASVTKYLNVLEEDGWVRRNRPTEAAARGEKERTQYTLLVPSGAEKGSPLVRHTDQTETREEAEEEAPSPSHGLALVRHTDQYWSATRTSTSPSHGLHNRRTPNTSSSSASAGASSPPTKAEEEEETRVPKTPNPNPTVAAIANALKIDMDRAGQIYVKIMSSGDIGAPSKYIAELIRTGDIAKFLERRPEPRPGTPKCDYEENPQEPGWCSRCKMPQVNVRHRAVA